MEDVSLDFSRVLRIGVRTVPVRMLENNLHPPPPSERLRLILTFISQLAHTRLDLTCITLYDDISFQAVAHLRVKAQLGKGTPDEHGRQTGRRVAADDLQGAGHGHKLPLAAISGLSEEHVHQFPLLCGRLELAVMLAEAADLGLGEPVVEALTVEGVGLGVDAGVVEGVVAGRADMLHLEGQPTAVAGGIAEELHVVARAAERGDVLAVLMEVGVGGALVDGGHGDGGLQLVEFRGLHRVELLTAHQTVLGERQQVVAAHAVGVGFSVEIS